MTSVRPSGALQGTGVRIFLVAALTLLLVGSYTLFPLANELRWALYVLLLVTVAWGVSRAVFRGSTPVPPLGLAEDAEARASTQLGDLLAMLERAEKGMKYSQRTIVLRTRRVFLMKLAALRGLNVEEAEALLADETKLETVIGAPLVAFLRESSREGFVLGGYHGASWTSELGRVLKAMEAWN